MKNKIELLVPEEKNKHIALNQKKIIRDIANKIEDKEELTEIEIELASGILWAWADQIPLVNPNVKHKDKVKLDPGSLAYEFAILRKSTGLSKTAAQEKLAKEKGVTKQAIMKALKKYEGVNLPLMPKE